MISLSHKSDSVGAFASTLCLVHCLATPLIFVAQSCSASCCSSAPGWWYWLDYLFLAISFFAIYWSGKTTSKKWVKIVLWICWIALLGLILNEKMEWFAVWEEAIYIPSLSLVFLHLYNRRYCQCQEDECCTHTKTKAVKKL
ncbi:MAG: MerC domain-containing protein [Flavobacteriales bacterium]|jgi:hypothetical protein|nr:MerC domain-containing protein [Flavobacteriales bacterium]